MYLSPFPIPFSDLHVGRIVAQGNRDAVLRPEILSPVYGLPMKRIDHAGGVMVVPIVTLTISPKVSLTDNQNV